MLSPRVAPVTPAASSTATSRLDIFSLGWLRLLGYAIWRPGCSAPPACPATTRGALQPSALDDGAARDAVLKATNDAGFMTRPLWTVLAELPMYRDCPAMPLEAARERADRLVNIPSSPNLIEG